MAIGIDWIRSQSPPHRIGNGLPKLTLTVPAVDILGRHCGDHRHSVYEFRIPGVATGVGTISWLSKGLLNLQDLFPVPPSWITETARRHTVAAKYVGLGLHRQKVKRSA